MGVPTYLFQDFTRKCRGYLPISNLFEGLMVTYRSKKSNAEGAPLFRPKKKVRESTQKVEIRSPCIEWVTMVVYLRSEVPGS